MLKIGIVYVIITTVLFLFPPELPVTGSNMSKSSCIFSFPFLSLLRSLVQILVNVSCYILFTSLQPVVETPPTVYPAISRARADSKPFRLLRRRLLHHRHGLHRAVVRGREEELHGSARRHRRPAARRGRGHGAGRDVGEWVRDWVARGGGEGGAEVKNVYYYLLVLCLSWRCGLDVRVVNGLSH